MLSVLLAWRGEITGVVAGVLSWLLLARTWRVPFWRLFLSGAVLGLAIEFMTEAQWTYTLQVFLWRDVSPFVILGWGLLFAWLVFLSNGLYRRWFGAEPGSRGGLDARLWLTDLVVGVPLFLGNELLGMDVLRVWQYNPVLHWTTLIPVIHYPLEGLVALVFELLALPAAVRYGLGGVRA